MEIVSEHTAFSREAREEREDSIGSLFLWSMIIVILIGLNAFSWVFCMYVFGNPEVPFCYQLLTRLKKLDPITAFEPVTAPRGRFNSARDLYVQFFDENDYPPEKLNAYNAILKRYYLKNYFELGDVTFISGAFRVENSRPLEPDDVFPHGLAVRLQADDFPDAHLDLVLPSPADAPLPGEHFSPGQIVQIEESAMCAALLNVYREENEQIVFTAVPLVKYEEDSPYRTPAGTELIVHPPERLNLDSGRWPLSDPGKKKGDEALDESQRTPEGPVKDSSGEKAESAPASGPEIPEP